SERLARMTCWTSRGSLGSPRAVTAYARLESRTIHRGRATRTNAARHLPGASCRQWLPPLTPRWRSKRVACLGGPMRRALAVRAAPSAPAQLGSDILENALEHVGVVVHAELIGDREQQRIRCHDRLVTGELFDERVGLTRVRAAEDGTGVGVGVADLILVVGVATEIRAVAVIDDREDAAAHGHARLTPVSGLLPGLTIGFDLLSLLDVQRLAGLVFFQSRALQVHAELRGPPGRRIGARTPPDPLAQTFGMRLETQQSRRI